MVNLVKDSAGGTSVVGVSPFLFLSEKIKPQVISLGPTRDCNHLAKDSHQENRRTFVRWLSLFSMHLNLLVVPPYYQINPGDLQPAIELVTSINFSPGEFCIVRKQKFLTLTLGGELARGSECFVYFPVEFVVGSKQLWCHSERFVVLRE